jgi:hypothetical protein
VADSSEHSNINSGSEITGEFLGHLSNYYFPKKDSAPWTVKNFIICTKAYGDKIKNNEVDRTCRTYGDVTNA